jgi:hypothetical protein
MSASGRSKRERRSSIIAETCPYCDAGFATSERLQAHDEVCEIKKQLDSLSAPPQPEIAAALKGWLARV